MPKIFLKDECFLCGKPIGTGKAVQILPVKTERYETWHEVQVTRSPSGHKLAHRECLEAKLNA